MRQPNLKLVTNNEAKDGCPSSSRPKEFSSNNFVSFLKKIILVSLYGVWLSSIFLFLAFLVMFAGLAEIHESIDDNKLGLMTLLSSVIFFTGFSLRNKFPKGDYHGF